MVRVWLSRGIEALGLLAFFALLWTLRSWNLTIGDGGFICGQTVSPDIFPITLSRSFLSYLLYRQMFYVLNPLTGWWVEDIIALSTCVAGVVCLWALIRLAKRMATSWPEAVAMVLFLFSTLFLQLYCGHIEFYPWANTAMMLAMLMAWMSLFRGTSVLWPSLALTFMAAFHSSGVFYFPALLVLPSLQRMGQQSGAAMQWRWVVIFLCAYLALAYLHRNPYLYFPILSAGLIAFFMKFPPEKRGEMNPYLLMLLPWLVWFSLRSVLRAMDLLRAEPLLEHIAPLWGEFDPGVYYYTFFSWEHLFDKLPYHLWLAPFGLLSIVGFWLFCRERVRNDRWLVFLTHVSVWAFLWSALFFPQLRERDWDLFASMSIPYNLFAVYAWLRFTPSVAKLLVPVMIVVQLCISIPIILSNSGLLDHRGYATLHFESRPVPAMVFVRGLRVAETPLELPNIRAGFADVRMISAEEGVRQYGSWINELVLEDGMEYHFSETLPPAPRRPVEPSSGDEE